MAFTIQLVCPISNSSCCCHSIVAATVIPTEHSGLVSNNAHCHSHHSSTANPVIDSDHILLNPADNLRTAAVVVRRHAYRQAPLFGPLGTERRNFLQQVVAGYVTKQARCC